MSAFAYPTSKLLEVIACLVSEFRGREVDDADRAAIKDAIKIYKELTGKEP